MGSSGNDYSGGFRDNGLYEITEFMNTELSKKIEKMRRDSWIKNVMNALSYSRFEAEQAYDKIFLSYRLDSMHVNLDDGYTVGIYYPCPGD